MHIRHTGVTADPAALGEVPALAALGALVLILIGIRITQRKPRPARKPAA